MLLRFRKGERIYWQGDRADALFQILEGKVQLTVAGASGKEAVVAILGPGSFLGVKCLGNFVKRTTNAVALTDGSLMAFDKQTARRRLQADPRFRDTLIAHLVARTAEYETGLTDQMFYSSEQRLARLLLKLCRSAPQRNGTSALVPKVTHEALAQMVGTTRPRVSHFMNKFRKLGLVEYDRVLRVHVGRMAQFLLSPEVCQDRAYAEDTARVSSGLGAGGSGGDAEPGSHASRVV